MNEAQIKTTNLICSLFDRQTIKKLIFSRFDDKNILKCEGRLILLKSRTALQLEYFTSDGKATQKNVFADALPAEIGSLISSCRQCNVITSSGEAELKTSKSGNSTLLDRIKGTDAKAEIGANDKKKKNILVKNRFYPFLYELGVIESDGRIIERKGAKFRQIDRFLQYVEDIYPRLGNGEELYVLDLCCGKSYLTFAVYWYLTEIKHRAVRMCGADLKADVIEYCSKTAGKLGYEGLSFVCTDISEFTPERTPDLVLSLHACDIATDIVLTTASRLGAKVILSTPCCQHQIMGQLKGESEAEKTLSPIMEHSLLKQKFAVALTDALRCKRLQAEGYKVDVTELIDPEDTPKNLMIRACRVPMAEEAKAKYSEEFRALSALCGIDLYGGIK